MKFLPVVVFGSVLVMAGVAQQAVESGTGSAAQQKSSIHTPAYPSAEAKLSHIQQNGQKSAPDTTPTELTAAECSAFVNEGGVTLPKGVTNVTFSSKPGTVTALTTVDFDKITEGKSSMNPLMILFNGVHQVQVVAAAAAQGGRGTVNVDSVSLDGVNVPRPALEYFVNHYIKPKYGPNVGLDSTFTMPARIQTATVGENKVTIIQGAAR